MRLGEKFLEMGIVLGVVYVNLLFRCKFFKGKLLSNK